MASASCRVFMLLMSMLSAVKGARTLFDDARYYGGTSFTDYLTKAGLSSMLKQPGNMSLFAPVPTAFQSLPAAVNQSLANDPAFLKNLMSYHIVTESVVSASFVDEELLPTVAGAAVRINKYNNSGNEITTVSGSPVLLVDLPCSNGMLFMMKKVIYPVPTGSAFDYVAESDNFSSLRFAITKAGMSQVFTADKQTVFAPDDAAFARLPPGVMDILLDDIPRLQGVLRHHVVNSGTLYSAGLYAGQVLNSLQGTLQIGAGGLTVNGSNITTADVTVTNGVLHTIDSVLISA
ncbi:transforming growth factor-beta-induced protein ig-h3-like [Haliotis rufescens]|uniref:transforming growth factor-beta-induced protein ig-h3-like n=1 Tax=Haliotis rufescens TaxID=6454 RepID=UPI00201FA149|nr:transforming growth factor-beta-induced protein ig-h3-like [Haliotis rufescens]